MITGSVAMRHWFSDFKRIPGDVDLFSPAEVKCKTPSMLLVETGWNDVFEDMMKANKDDVFLDPDLLMTLKASHLQWDIKWEKNSSDFRFLTRKGVSINREFYERLVQHWKTVHGDHKAHINLRVPNEDFFKDYVRRETAHDELHRFAAYGSVPMHQLIKKDPSLAYCDRDMFQGLSEKEKLMLAVEECTVVAIERFNLTLDMPRSKKVIGFRGAYKKLVTAMTKGWFCDFLIENIDHVFNEWNWVDTTLEKKREFEQRTA